MNKMTKPQLAAFLKRRDAQSELTRLLDVTLEEIMSAYFAGNRDFMNIRIKDADFRNFDLRYTRFNGSKFIGCRFDRAVFDCSIMSNCTFTDCIMQMTAQHADFSYSVFSKCNMKFITLYGSEMRDCTFTDCDMYSANGNRASFDNCVFGDTNLYGARFNYASFVDADLFTAKFVLENNAGLGEIISYVNLLDANLRGAILPSGFFVSQLWLTGMSSRNDYLKAIYHGGELKFLAGCFFGNEENLRKRIAETKMKDESQAYLAAIDLIVGQFNAWKEKNSERKHRAQR